MSRRTLAPISARARSTFLPHRLIAGAHHQSDAFDDDERLVIEYAEGITRTPVDVPDELFARLRERFDEAALVELTYAAAIENLRARFNWALGIDSQDYSEGAVCTRPEPAPAGGPSVSAAEAGRGTSVPG